MKFKFYTPEINPIYRDMLIVVVAGLLVSVAFVTVGFMILSRI